MNMRLKKWILPNLPYVGIALFATGIAYYGLWILAVGTFLLAVYYTVKMM